MRFISTRAHGVLDYLMGLLLIASPWILGFGYTSNTIEVWLPPAVGGLVILYSAFTDYEFGVSRLIPMRTHLLLDVLGGLFLAASPWIFGFSERLFLPHLILGLAEVGAGLMTRTSPEGHAEGHDGAMTPRTH